MVGRTLAFIKKKAQEEGRVIVFVDESGFQLLPSVVKTYAPVGETPVLRHKLSREKINVISGITPDGKIYTQLREENISSSSIVSFLKHLQRSVEQKCLVIWDGAAIHFSKEVKAFLRENKGRIHLEKLPPYSPELNPDELVWSYLKSFELGNFCAKNINHLKRELRLAIMRLRSRTHIISSFFQILEVECS